MGLIRHKYFVVRKVLEILSKSIFMTIVGIVNPINSSSTKQSIIIQTSIIKQIYTMTRTLTLNGKEVSKK